MLSDPVFVITKVSRVLDAMGVFHFVGGSVASSVYGIPRATQDADIVADLMASHVPALTQAVEGEFYVDAGMILDAIRSKRSFNLIHLETLYKVDVFILKDTPWSHEEVARCRFERLGPNSEDWSVRIASPEDTILHKLAWYRAGGSVSDRQWCDVQGVLKVQAKGLDMEYLHRWAKTLDLAELLEKALAQTG
jgi:hypothetical protein